MSVYLIGALLVLVAFNLYVNIKLLLSDALTGFQKAAQTLILWFIPVIGGLIVLYFSDEPDPPPPPKSFADGNSGNDSILGKIE